MSAGNGVGGRSRRLAAEEAGRRWTPTREPSGKQGHHHGRPACRLQTRPAAQAISHTPCSIPSAMPSSAYSQRPRCGCTCRWAPSGTAASCGGAPNVRPTSRSSWPHWPSKVPRSRGHQVGENFDDMPVRFPRRPCHRQLTGPVAGRVGARVALADLCGLVSGGRRGELRVQHAPVARECAAAPVQRHGDVIGDLARDGQ